MTMTTAMTTTAPAAETPMISGRLSDGDGEGVVVVSLIASGLADMFSVVLNTCPTRYRHCVVFVFSHTEWLVCTRAAGVERTIWLGVFGAK